jgi:hypothetical protein
LTEAWRRLYGADDGTYLLIEGASGTVTVPSISVSVPNPIAPNGGPGRVVPLANLGRPVDVLKSVHNRFGGSYQHTAVLTHVSSTAVWRYLAGTREPRLPPAGWVNLVRAYMADSGETDVTD